MLLKVVWTNEKVYWAGVIIFTRNKISYDYIYNMIFFFKKLSLWPTYKIEEHRKYL